MLTHSPFLFLLLLLSEEQSVEQLTHSHFLFFLLLLSEEQSVE